MKRLIFTLATVALLSSMAFCLMVSMMVTPRADTASTDAMPAPSENALPTLGGEEAVSYLKQQGLHTSLGEAMAAARYGVHWSKHTPWKDLPGAYYAGNPAQQMTAFFTEEGIYLEAQSASENKWRMGMRLTGLGYGERLLRVTAGEMKVNGNRVEIERRVESRESGVESSAAADSRLQTPDSRLVEWYVNRAEGIEQGFIVDAAPGERREGEWLRLRLALEGDLRARLADDGEAVDLLTRGGERALRYDKLHVYDAAGRELLARMRVEGGEVMLEVEEGEAVYPLTIDPVFSQQQKLTASDGAANDLFGESVAISGETVVVGAVFDDVGANDNQGSAYIFVRNGTVWSEQQKLTASDGAAFDDFGSSVAISGESVVVGAPFDDVGANTDQGSAYIFVRTGTVWSEQQRLTTDGAALDNFGNSVAISGESVVVGAPGDDVGVNGNQGSAYIFVRVGTVWSEQQQLTTDGTAFDVFGFSVAISGESVVVGALGDDVGANGDQGSAYIFVRNGTVWSEQQKLTASDGAASDLFGQSVAISGESVVVGASDDNVGANADQGSAYIFVRVGTAWSEQQKLTAADGAASDFFGNAVAISGESVVVGAVADDVGANADQGSAYIFVRTGTLWSEQQRLTASDGAAFDDFGSSVAISGETVMVGAFDDNVGANTDQGSAYIFACTSTQQWVEQAKATASDGAASDFFGNAIAISGETVVVGAFVDDVGANANQGSAYIFVRNGTVWSEQQKLTASDGAAGDDFGNAVAISGESVVVGTPNDNVGANLAQGSAYIFVRAGTVWSEQQKLTASDGAVSDFFGFSVAISGESVVVGAVFDDVGANEDQGSAYIFVRNGTVWSEQQRLTASDGTAFDDFGYSVAISGESVMVGAILDDIGANSEQGSAYIFVRNGTVWNEQQKLTAADGGMDDNFGISVGISGESVVVGAVGGNVGKNTEQGSAYVFVRVGTVWSEQQKLTASDGAVNDFFGFSVAISGESVVVGAPFDDVGANDNQGSAYVFVRVGTAWSEQQKLTASDGAADDQFGFSVAISGKTVVVGARVNDVGANTDQGSAYIFFLPCMNNMPPVITCPVNLTVIAANPGSTTVVVNYPPPVATDDGGAPSVVCLPPSGSAFPLGTTTVTCTATDSTGNTTQCSFTVTVFDICLQDDSNATTVLLLNSLTGDYRFCCSGSIFAGKGTVQKSGSTFTLTHNTVDRRVTAKLDSALNRGAASLQSPVGTTRCTINDRNRRNNTCACSVGG